MITTTRISDMQLHPDSKVLVFMPHPDDEAVFLSGFVKRLTRKSINVKVITMTVGEKSTLRYGLSPVDDLGNVRRKELEKSFLILGVKNYDILSLPDGGLKNCKSEIKRTVQNEIKNFQPTHVVTLEPDGVYGHPDHIALSEAITAVVKKPTRLLYATINKYKVKPKASNMAEKEIHPLKPQFVFRLGLLERLAKIRSIRAHKSQFKVTKTDSSDFNFFKTNKMLGNEYFVYRDDGRSL